jgi:transposase InsO family protein
VWRRVFTGTWTFRGHSRLQAIVQRELLDRQRWATRAELASAIFEYIEGWFNPRRRHSYCHMHSPIDYEALHTNAATAA